MKAGVVGPCGLNFGHGRDRPYDPMIKSHLLYQLSYVPAGKKTIRSLPDAVNTCKRQKTGRRDPFSPILGHERSRTFDLCLRRAALYPAELRDRAGQAAMHGLSPVRNMGWMRGL